VERAAHTLFVVALVLGAAALALLTAQGLLAASLFDQGVDLDTEYWTALAFAGITATLCAIDVTALVFALRGRRLLTLYRQERADWHEARQAQGSLLGRR
jgi:hypothetical protein